MTFLIFWQLSDELRMKRMNSYLLWRRRSDIVAFIVIRVLEKALSGGRIIPRRSTGGTSSIGPLHRQESTKQIPSQVWLQFQNTFQFTRNIMGTLQSMMNAKLSQQSFRPCHYNKFAKKIPVRYPASLCKLKGSFPSYYVV